MSAKQDRQGVRTPADLERKYDFGTMKKQFSEVQELSVGTKNEVSRFAKEFREEFTEQIEAVQEQIDRLKTDVETGESETGEQVSGLRKDLEDLEKQTSQFRSETDQKISDLELELESTKRTAMDASMDAQAVVNDVNTHFSFEEGGTRFLGAIVPMVLPAGTDLDGVILPNKYTSGNVTEYEYVNCPITTGTFSLEVESVGNEGQLLQRLTYSHKTEGKTFERVFDLDEWGQWVLVSDYAWTSVETVEDDAETLEAAFDKFKTDTNSALTTIRNNVSALDQDTQSLERSVQAVSTDLQGVINDMNDHFSFVEGGTTFKGGIIPLILPPGTDLDGVTNPNKYTSGNVAEYQYLNCPITSGTFFLEVEMCGSQGQLLQRLTYSHKTNGKTYERGFYSDGWGAWVLVTDYTGAALKAIQLDVDALEKTVTDHKTAYSAWKQKTEDDIANLSEDLNALSGSTQTLNGNVQSMSSDLQGVINDVNDHFEFNEGGMTIKGGINPLLLPAGTDLDGIMNPNKYVGGTVTEYNYLNCPVPSGTFLLNVELCGEKGQVKQSLSYCNKTLGRTYERYFYGDSWGEWVCVTDFVPAEPEETGKLLWNEGVYYMTATQTVNLPEAVSAQKNGIVLVFSEYANGAASDSAFHCFFVPKIQVATQPGKSYIFTLATSRFTYMATKQVLIYDTKIEGHADNNQTGAGTSGITFTNNRFVLRYVFGV